MPRAAGRTVGDCASSAASVDGFLREPREFRNLHWEGGVEKTNVTGPAGPTDVAPKNLDEIIQKEIKKSIELEKGDKANP